MSVCLSSQAIEKEYRQRREKPWSANRMTCKEHYEVALQAGWLFCKKLKRLPVGKRCEAVDWTGLSCEEPPKFYWYEPL